MSPNDPVKYEELLSNPNYFWDKLSPLLGLPRTNLRIPIMGGKFLNLHRLFIEVTTRGGMEKVTKDRKWAEVSRAFNFPSTLTNGSFLLKNNYIKFLYQFELVYFFGKPGILQDINRTSVCLFKTFTLCHCHYVMEVVASGTDEPQVGNEVEGIIDGKFENGYLVTVKIGSEEMKGVLYEIPEQTMETPSAIVPSSSKCCDKKKAKMAVVDSEEPKCFRINLRTDIAQYYFFAEQYDRLKPYFNGEEQTLMREIERLWSNLTESEKRVYKERQSKALKDVK